MTCLQLWFVPDTPLRQALRKASLDRNTNVEYSRVSLRDEDTHVKAVSLHAVKSVGAGFLSQYVSHLYLTLTTPISSLDTNRSVNALSRKVSTRNIT